MSGRSGVSVRWVIRKFGRYVPGLVTAHWRWVRHQHCKDALAPLQPAISTLRENCAQMDSPVRVLVVPDIAKTDLRWNVASGSIFFEIFQSAREALGADVVLCFEVDANDSELEFHRRLLDCLHRESVTHLVVQIEEDPCQRGEWSWDVVFTALKTSWTGAVIGVSYDAGHGWLRERARRLSRLYDHLLLADLGMPMSGVGRRKQLEVGPVTMPLSDASRKILESAVQDEPKVTDVSFFGALYDYRLPILEKLHDFGIEVTVNPHRQVVARNYIESRTDMPSYVAYMKGLARSEITLNFSRSASADVEQYKIRIVEAALMRCLPFTDDSKMTKQFFSQPEFESFRSPVDLQEKIQFCLENDASLSERQEAAYQRAVYLVTNDFWTQVNSVLAARGMEPLF